MELALTPEQHALQQELREYFAKIVTPEIEEEMATGEMGGAKSKDAIRQMGKDGWLGIGWREGAGSRLELGSEHGLRAQLAALRRRLEQQRVDGARQPA